MQPSGPTSGIPAAPARPSGQTPAPPLQVGQLLQATVLENSAGKLLLSLGHRQLAAESSLPFRPGEVLTLEVRSLGEQPVLKVVTALQASATAAAVRMLLPRYGATTPLLASLPQLAQAPAGSLPAPLADAVRALLRQLPDRASLGTADGVKTAVARSGSFMERQLVRVAAGNTPRGDSLDSDFKANLLRLLAQLRALPAAESRQPETAGRQPAAGYPPPAAAGRTTSLSPPPPQTPPRSPAAPPPSAEDTGGRPPATHTDTPARSPGGTAGLLPQAVKYALAAGPASGARPATTPPGAAATATAAPGQPRTDGGAHPPPPFAGVVPEPQLPVKAVLDLLRSLAHLRPELLQQTEAALARIHLNQLASLPREGEHRLVEWLFDIPVRRGEDIDLWSARLYRDADGQGEAAQTPRPVWHVQLAFDLPGLGPMQAHISLQGERVSTQFRATRPETLPLLENHLPELRRALLDVGLEVGTLDCRAGSLASAGPAPRDPLINEHA